MAFTNIIDIIYPIGSLYESTASTSPAILFGGTWTQIKGACLAATGENNFAVNDYGGKIKIQATQLPQHVHNIRYNISKTDIETWDNEPLNDIDKYPDNADWNKLATTKSVLETGGNNKIVDGSVVYKQYGSTAWINVMYAGKLLLGGGQDFLPYHFGCYMWYRTA